MGHDYHKPYFWYLVVSTVGIFLTHTETAGPSFSPLLSQAAIVVMAAVAASPRRLRASLTTLAGPVAFLFVGLLLSLLLSQVLHLGDKTLHKEFVATILILTLFLNREEWPRIRRSIVRYSAFMVGFSFLLLVLDGIVPIRHFWWQGRMIGAFSQPNMTAATLALTLPFVLTSDVLKDRQKLLLTLGIGVLIALTRSRTSTGIAMFAVGTYILRPWTMPWRPNRTLVLAVLAGSLVLLPFAETLIDFLSRGQDVKQMTSLTGRTALWMSTVARIQGNVMTGIGSAAAEVSVWSRVTQRYFETSGGAHNFYLAQALTYGVPHAAVMTLTLLAAVLALLYRLRRAAITPDTFLDRAWVTMALPGIVIFSATESGSAYPIYFSGQIFWLFLAQTVLSEKGLGTEPRQTEETKTRHLALVTDRTTESA